MRLATLDHAQSLAKSLRGSLEDHPDLVIVPLLLGEIYGQKLYGVAVSLPSGRTMTYALRQLDNGACGIQDDVLVEIRQALGEAIAYRPRPADRPGKYFSDIMALEPENDRGDPE